MTRSLEIYAALSQPLPETNHLLPGSRGAKKKKAAFGGRPPGLALKPIVSFLLAVVAATLNGLQRFVKLEMHQSLPTNLTTHGGDGAGVTSCVAHSVIVEPIHFNPSIAQRVACASHPLP